MNKLFSFLAGLMLSLNILAQTTIGASGISGTGTAGFIPKFTANKKIGNSSIFDNVTDIKFTTPLSYSSTANGSLFQIDQNSNVKIIGPASVGSGSNLQLGSNASTTTQLELRSDANSSIMFYNNNTLCRKIMMYNQATYDDNYRMNIMRLFDFDYLILSQSGGFQSFKVNASNGEVEVQRLKLASLPTSSVGLGSGRVYRSGEDLKIVP